MNPRRVNTAAGVILAAMQTRQTAAGIAEALESACLLQSPETAAEWRSMNEALSDAAEQLRVQRDRITELEAAAAKVAEFCADRASYITSIRNCHPDNSHDYNRWQGHAQARRHLSQTLGLPVAWPAEDTPQRTQEDVSPQVTKLRGILAGQRRQQEIPRPTPGELAEQRYLLDPLDHTLEALAPHTTTRSTL